MVWSCLTKEVFSIVKTQNSKKQMAALRRTTEEKKKAMCLDFHGPPSAKAKKQDKTTMEKYLKTKVKVAVKKSRGITRERGIRAGEKSTAARKAARKRRKELDLKRRKELKDRALTELRAQ